MEIIVKKETDKEIEFEIIGEKTILNPLKQKLLGNKDVDYAGWNTGHPLLANPEFYVRVKKGNAREVVRKAIKDLKNDIEDIKGYLESEGSATGKNKDTRASRKESEKRNKKDKSNSKKSRKSSKK